MPLLSREESHDFNCAKSSLGLASEHWRTGRFAIADLYAIVHLAAVVRPEAARPKFAALRCDALST